MNQRAAQTLPDVEATDVLDRIAAASETGAALVRAAIAESQLAVLMAKAPAKK